MTLPDLSPDNPIEQAVLKTFMQRKKISYSVASNGQEAVEKWRTGNYHLVLVKFKEGSLSMWLTWLADGYTDAHNGRDSGNERDSEAGGSRAQVICSRGTQTREWLFSIVLYTSGTETGDYTISFLCHHCRPHSFDPPE
jgi:hypothetical protein